jgi:hypothetical protein
LINGTIFLFFQKLDTENPRHLLARGEEVSLTKEELKRLRQDIQEQESLIKGYQVSLF